MNGAAMDCRQDQVLRSQHKGSSGLHSPGYHFQINCSRQQNSQPQHSKTKNYQLLSQTFLVDRSSESYLQPKDLYDVDSRQKSIAGDMWDPRSVAPHPPTREPLELPVPRFEIDENYVGEPPPVQEDRCNFVEDSKSLDLDTRIDLLIKSKALAGMHPIFSELDQSGESSYDSDESFLTGPKLKKRLAKKQRSLPPEERIVCQETFHDPETPLSRPPSPFLSRATYLFWFNKAIEIKQQAKAQEQALLEKANKRLLQENFSTVKTAKIDKTSPIKESKPIVKSLLDEISKEFKEIVKQEFLKEVIQNAAFSALENWWEKQSHNKEKKSMASSECNIKSDKTMNDNLGLVNEVKAEYQGSTSPKVPFPGIKVDGRIDEKFSNVKNKNSIVSKENSCKRTTINNHLDPPNNSKTSSNRTDEVETLGDGSVLLMSEILKREDSCNENSDLQFRKDQNAIAISCDETEHSIEYDPAILLPESTNISQTDSKPRSQNETFSDHAYALPLDSPPCGGVGKEKTAEDVNQTVRKTLDTIINSIGGKTSIDTHPSNISPGTVINEENPPFIGICNNFNVSSNQSDNRLKNPESPNNKDIAEDKVKPLKVSLSEISNNSVCDD